MANYSWETDFLNLFHRCLDRYQAGDTKFENYYSDDDLRFLRSIGYKKREFFDFIEDYGDDKEPTPATAVLVAAVRRDYLHIIQKNELSEKRMELDDLPPKKEELGGIEWLPRIIVKAEAKLRGELHPEVMYSCGGDRAFLRKHDIHSADFLRVVWAADGDHDYILDYVRK